MPDLSSVAEQLEEHLPFAERLPISHDESALEQQAWKGLTLVSGVLAALLARSLIAAIWSRVKGDTEPVDPSDPQLDWSTALQWAVASGVGVGIARLVGQRTAAKVWEQATGSLPPRSNAESALRKD